MSAGAMDDTRTIYRTFVARRSGVRRMEKTLAVSGVHESLRE
jgi:hypothetical protein